MNVTSSIDPRAGGVSEAILRLSKAVIELGHQVEIVSADAPDSSWGKSLQVPVHMKGPALGPLEYSRDFERWLMQNCGRFDAIISHGLWRFNSRATRLAARSAGRPYFIFPHGMLDPWFKRHYPAKHLKKCLFWWLTEYSVLRDARAVLFTCREELLLARESFRPYKCVERVVPLGTHEPPGNKDEHQRAFLEAFPQIRNKRVILFLGRLHEKKGCDLLLRAFQNLLESKPKAMWRDLHLMIAGPCAHADYLELLKQLAGPCEAVSPGSVSFPGMLSDDLKWGALRQAEVFILPSHQENFGIAVVEAMACGTPVLISRPVNIWHEIESSGAGLVDFDTVEGCSRLLAGWLGLSAEDKARMGVKAHDSFKQHFEITQTAVSLIDTIRSFEPDSIRQRNEIGSMP
ncbi:MAG: glycosyltransferase [Methylacidiphilales bacterium]|nr:glycosyltransferase [Candidatus Methylacidiphilales bacterium]